VNLVTGEDIAITARPAAGEKPYVDCIPSADGVVLRPIGAFVTSALPILSSALLEHVGACRVVLDADGMTDLSEAGVLSLLVGHWRMRRAGGRLTIVRPSATIAAMLTSMNVHLVVPMELIPASESPHQIRNTKRL
jgi:anti-anti-sigma regulatory factor